MRWFKIIFFTLLLLGCEHKATVSTTCESPHIESNETFERGYIDTH